MRGISKALIWVNELKDRHIRVFEFSELPEDLRDLSRFRQAVSQGKIRKIKKTNRWKYVWEVK